MIYIGSAEVGLGDRMNSHILDLKKNQHGNWQFQLLYWKYGLENLSFYVVEYCPRAECKKLESHYIEEIDPEINLQGKNDTHLGDIYEYIDKVTESQQEFTHTKEGFDWHRKKAQKWLKNPGNKSMTRKDIKNMWDRLSEKGLSEADKISEILYLYKAYLPQKLWNNKDLIEYIKKTPPLRKAEFVSNNSHLVCKQTVDGENIGCIITFIILLLLALILLL